MDDKLNEIVSNVKYALSKEPLAMIIGKINDGKSDVENILVKSYCDFLCLCNGARCGSIDLWSDEVIADNQYKVLELDGGVRRWVCIGQVLYEPLVMEKETEEVYLFYQGFENEIDGKKLGKFNTFLYEYVFGERYNELIPDANKEEWYLFMKKMNFLK